MRPKTNISRTIKGFLLSEEGKISKDELLKAGVIITGAGLAAIISAHPGEAAHTNSLSLSKDSSGMVSGAHTHSTATGTSTSTSTSTGTGTGGGGGMT